MTLQQQAYGLIDRLPDDSVQVVIQVMRRMLPRDKDVARTAARLSDSVTPKMKAYLRMQELRKETSKYDVSEAQREAAMDEKFGTFG
ncbi:MAG: hypothetical protein IJ719_04955 [Clostridia bacterium]|nr:hypothetical protein [Clostridia bacterium]